VTSSKIKVLIIEDEPIIAFDLDHLLNEAGFVVVGIAHRLEKAISLINRVDYDVAIVDANLNGVSSDPAALALTARRVPFVVLSGYSLQQKQALFPSACFIQKPCKPDQLIAAIRTALARSKAANSE
jgi:DNA-binding response OmpR family regulator